MLGRERYYEDEGRAHDYLMRCKDCQKLVTFVAIQKLGCCDKCGNKRFTEITLLQQEEMDDIQSGKIDFDGREAFLAEFAAIDVINAKREEEVRLAREARILEEANHLGDTEAHIPATCSICVKEAEDKALDAIEHETCG